MLLIAFSVFSFTLAHILRYSRHLFLIWVVSYMLTNIFRNNGQDGLLGKIEAGADYLSDVDILIFALPTQQL